MEDFQKIVTKIVEKTGKKESEILELIRKKQKEYNDLISDYGAAYLVARDLGIEIEREKDNEYLKIKDLLEGISGVRIKAKVLQIYDPVLFERENGIKGKVMNVLIGDETGTARLVLWDDQVEDFEYKEGDVIEILNGYTRERRGGGIEIRLGMYGLIKKIDEDIEVKEYVQKKEYERKKIISVVRENENIEAKCYITKLFYKNPIIYYCRECNQTKDNSKCAQHGEIEPIIVISGTIADETSSLIFNMFDPTVEDFIGLSKKEIIKVIEEKGQDYFYDVLKNTINVKYLIRGHTKKNKYNNNIELTITRIRELDPVHELSLLLKEYKGASA